MSNLIQKGFGMAKPAATATAVASRQDAASGTKTLRRAPRKRTRFAQSDGDAPGTKRRLGSGILLG